MPQRAPTGSSVRIRLTLWNVGVLGVVLVALGIALRYVAHEEAMASVDRALAGRAALIRRAWAYRLSAPFAAQILRASALGPDTARPEPSALDLTGRPSPPTMRPAPWDAAAFHAAMRGREEYATVQYDGEAVRIYSTPLRRRGQIVGVLQVAEPLEEIERGLDGLSSALLLMAPIAILLAGVVGAFLTDGALRPVRDVTRTAERIGASNLSERLPVSGRDEFSQLAGTINGMLGRLELSFLRMEEAFEQQRRFTADVSHELRTPLTVIKAHTSLALSRESTVADCRRALAAADRAAEQMNRIIQDLLLLARSDAGQLSLRLRSLPIGHVLETARESFVGPDQPSIEIARMESPLYVMGDHTHLVRLFTNLIENAVRYTPASGRIRLQARGADEHVIVTVEDTGTGIPPEHLPHVCERFYRVDRARSRVHGGSGLGLSICQSILELHRGSLAIESTPGQGATVRVTLPRAARRANGAEPPAVESLEPGQTS